MTVTQEGTRTHDLTNGLPFSNQLSYKLHGNSVAEFEYIIRLSCQGSSRSGYQAGMSDGDGSRRNHGYYVCTWTGNAVYHVSN